ncbi:CinA family protein [Pelagibacteraceae bacterium]|nr:CinA family protein [Pelagibacteraceae bacterium]
MKNYIQIIKKLRTKFKFTISVAESCTGGMLSKNLTSIGGSSQFFNGSIISYSNDFKNQILNVPKKTILKYGAVSHETALAMVKGLKKTNSEILISITGVAGPSGGSARTPIGCVYFGIGSKINNKYTFLTIKKNFSKSSRQKIQTVSTEFALKKIIEIANKTQ